MIKFNVPYSCGKEVGVIAEAMQLAEFSGGGHFTALCERWLCEYMNAHHVLLTSSCTHALEMCALLCDIQPGDEVIMPSFNFVSAANAFVLRGARIVFVDIRPDTMNIDEDLIEQAVTSRTKAILIMHYGGTCCDMDRVMALANRKGIYVIEDAAHCIGATYKGRHLGTIGHLGALSFHATKNIHCGEGGALIVNGEELVHRAEVIREKGTNRKEFLEGVVDKYTWVDIGSSYAMSELSAAFLWAQLPMIDQVNEKRKVIWNSYHKTIRSLLDIPLMEPPGYGLHNGHIFFIKTRNASDRASLIRFMREKQIQVYFHYLPLHLSAAGKKYGVFNKEDAHTTSESGRLLRLPLHHLLDECDVERVSESIHKFYKQPKDLPFRV